MSYHHRDLLPMLTEAQVEQLQEASAAYQEHTAYLQHAFVRDRAREHSEKRGLRTTLGVLEQFITTVTGSEMSKHATGTVERAANMGDLTGF